MNPALAQDRTALRVNLTVPTTAGRLGPFAFDGLKALIGMDLADALASLIHGPRTQRPVLGVVVDVYPLAIPDGEGLSVKAQLAVEIAAGEAAGPRLRAGVNGGTVAEFAVRLKPGMRKAVPLGTWGELGGGGVASGSPDEGVGVALPGSHPPR